MDIEDILKLLVPFIWFAIATAARAARKRGKGSQTPAEATQSPQYDFDVDDEPVSAEPRTGQAAQERVQAQLQDVFRQLGLDVEFPGAKTSAPADHIDAPDPVRPQWRQEREWTPDEAPADEVATDAVFYEDATDAAFHEDATDAAFYEDATDAAFYEDATDAAFHEDATDAAFYEDATDASFDEDAPRSSRAAELRRLQRARRDALEQAARIRRADTPHLDATDVKSTEIVRDALVLNAILQRPQWRGPRREPR